MEKKENLLFQIWKKTEKQWDTIKQKRAAKSLRVQAEQDLLELQDNVIKIEEKVEKAILDAKDNKDWKKIRKSSLEKTLAEKELKEASKLYEEFFDKKASEILED